MADFPDISSWQENANLVVLKAGGYDTISLKATEGAGYVDPPFASRWQQAKALGLTRWAYHFAQPGDPVADADHFLAVVNAAGGYSQQDRLMLDFESAAWQGSGNWADARGYAIGWCNRLRALVGPSQPILIYSYHDYEQNSHVVRSDLPSVGLVIAAYGSSYTLPPGWDHACVWQFTDGKYGNVTYFPGVGTVDGNRQLCDLHDCFQGDEELNDADKKWLTDMVSQQVSNGVKAELTYLMGTRTLPKGNPPTGPITLANILDAVFINYHGIDGDPTHPGLTDVVKAAADTNSRISNIQVGTVDPSAVRAALAGLKIQGAISE